MTGYRFSSRSLDNLKGVHPDLIACVVLALYKYTPVDFMVVEGMRSLEDQRIYFAEGSTWTMASKHLVQSDGTSHAVDLAPIVEGAVPWHSWDKFEDVNRAMQIAADEVGVAVKWGGDWKVKDGPHYQLQT